ncbi:MULTISPECIES: hypothetical protein [Carnobacterium]|uniref:Uncharacterized protein n=1 Tax=Carnobacterium inhibens TaxID=147709 RepID=A0ABR7TBR1_9LACT|nr:hypothetical protein [Carnobacterium inhibens]MBC9825349.1 hypothetical protein [Carnobacterium inhibens]
MENRQLANVVKNVEQFKKENIQILRKNINNEILNYRKNLPIENLSEELELQIENEVSSKLSEFNNGIDLKPAALYYSLKSEVELDENISEKELTYSAYDFLEKTTKSKFLKKILKELKRETKK